MDFPRQDFCRGAVELTDDFQVGEEDRWRVGRDLAEVGPVVNGHRGLDPQPPVVGQLVQLQRVAVVGAEGVAADRQDAQTRVLPPEPRNLSEEQEVVEVQVVLEVQI